MAANYTWPSTLPQEPFANGDVAYTPSDNFIRPTMDVGAAKGRRRFTAVSETLPVTLRLSMSQLATLRGFMRTVGALQFNWTDFTTMLPCTYVFTSGAAPKFIGVEELSGEFWYEVTFNLEMNP